jgi:DNA-binding transcriptional MerR regulator
VNNAVPARTSLSIGEVLGQLRPDFPDVTISKIRFLESEGLVEPTRTASGYRKFSPADVRRLHYVLTAQRDRYLPLRVIKDHLDALDRGLEPPEIAGGSARVPVAIVTPDSPEAEEFAADRRDIRLSRTELREAAGLTDEQLDLLENYGLVAPQAGTQHYDADALTVAQTVAQMSSHGLEPRHLRAFKTAADREVGLVEQVVTPLLRQRNPQSRARAEAVVRELAALSVRLHAALVRSRLGAGLPR